VAVVALAVLAAGVKHKELTGDKIASATKEGGFQWR